MPTIPRYQPRGGPSVGGLNYAGAYSPPDGSDLRTLARVADAAGGMFGLFQQKPKPARTAQPKGADAPQAPPDGPAAPTVEDHLLGKAGDVSWRRNHITADIDALDPEVFDGRVDTVKGGWFRSAYKTGKIVAAPYKSQATGERKNYFFKDR